MRDPTGRNELRLVLKSLLSRSRRALYQNRHLSRGSESCLLPISSARIDKSFTLALVKSIGEVDIVGFSRRRVSPKRRISGTKISSFIELLDMVLADVYAKE